MSLFPAFNLRFQKSKITNSLASAQLQIGFISKKLSSKRVKINYETVIKQQARFTKCH